MRRWRFNPSKMAAEPYEPPAGVTLYQVFREVDAQGVFQREVLLTVDEDLFPIHKTTSKKVKTSANAN